MAHHFARFAPPGADADGAGREQFDLLDAADMLGGVREVGGDVEHGFRRGFDVLGTR